MEDERVTFLRELAALCKKYQVTIRPIADEVAVGRGHTSCWISDLVVNGDTGYAFGSWSTDGAPGYMSESHEVEAP